MDKWYHKNVNISTFHSNQIKYCVETNCVQISHLEIQQSLVTDRGENEQKCHIFLFHAAWKTRSLIWTYWNELQGNWWAQNSIKSWQEHESRSEKTQSRNWANLCRNQVPGMVTNRSRSFSLQTNNHSIQYLFQIWSSPRE